MSKHWRALNDDPVSREEHPVTAIQGVRLAAEYHQPHVSSWVPVGTQDHGFLVGSSQDLGVRPIDLGRHKS